MRAEELRIGNYYLSYGVDLKQVERLTKDKVLIDFHPITLTKEWLLKFGFKTDDFKHEFELDTINLDCEYTDEGEWNLFLKGKNIKPVESKNEYRCEYYPKAEIKYVHQLQNLYFALTGEELIK